MAARVACRASSTRAFFSFISLSVAAADVDLGDAAGQLGEPLFELLVVVVARGVVDLAADRLDPALDRVRLARRLR